MRERKSLTKASKEMGLDRKAVKQHVISAIYKRKGKWKAKAFDKIQRGMNIYESGKVNFVVVNNSRNSSRIGKYYNDVKKALETNDEKVLQKYERSFIIDSKGKRHKLETKLEKIKEIEEAKEEPEIYEIYEG